MGVVCCTWSGPRPELRRRLPAHTDDDDEHSDTEHIIPQWYSAHVSYLEILDFLDAKDTHIPPLVFYKKREAIHKIEQIRVIMGEWEDPIASKHVHNLNRSRLVTNASLKHVSELWDALKYFNDNKDHVDPNCQSRLDQYEYQSFPVSNWCALHLGYAYYSEDKRNGVKYRDC